MESKERWNTRIDRIDLPFKSVHLRCLDCNKNVLSVGTGFIRRENDSLFLYTCWHVITGYDMRDIKVKYPPNKMYIEINYVGTSTPQEGIECIGGSQKLILPLYDFSTDPITPLWYQDRLSVPQPDLNAINIRVPFWHDLAKIALPIDANISDIQVIEDQGDLINTLRTTDKALIVGFPYGYSATGTRQPTPVVITRHVAADQSQHGPTDILLDGIGAQGMSGAPIFAQIGDTFKLAGIYCGSIFPDNIIEKYNPVTALGIACRFILLFKSPHLGLVQYNDPLNTDTEAYGIKYKNNRIV